VDAQADAYREVLSWILATAAVKAVAMAEPSDQFTRPLEKDAVYAAPSLFAVGGVPKAVLLMLNQLFRNPRPLIPELVTDAALRAQVPLGGAVGSGFPKAWNTTDVWHLVPVDEAPLPGGEFRHRATFYRNIPAASKNPNPNDFGMFWYLTWTKGGLVFQVERSANIVLLGNQSATLKFEVRGPGYYAHGTTIVGVNFDESSFAGTWSSGGHFLRLVFRVPPRAGWGPGTLFFFRFSGTDNDGRGDLGLTLDPWPLTTQGGDLPWKAFRIVIPYN